MSRDPLIYEDPLLFNPDRWTREGRKEKAFAHLPFGFGPRACYGEGTFGVQLCTPGYSLCSNIAGLIKWRIGAMFIASQTPHHGIACVLLCEAVLLFALSAGRRLAELELVLLLVQVCVLMSIAVYMYVMVCIVIGLYEGVSA